MNNSKLSSVIFAYFYSLSFYFSFGYFMFAKFNRLSGSYNMA